MKIHWLGYLVGFLVCGCVGQVGGDISPPGFSLGAGGEVTGSGAQGTGGDSLPGSSGTGGAAGTFVPDPGVGGGGSSSASAPYCAVRQMITTRCLGCHTNPPIAGAPMPLVTYVDLLVPARSMPARMVAEVALDRIQDAARPMPPSGSRATAAEIQSFQDWLLAGTPQGSCTAPPPTGAGGAVGVGGAGGASGVDAGGRGGAGGAGGVAVVDAGRDTGRDAAVAVEAGPPPVVDPFAAAPVCSSNTRWTGGNNANMRPGEPCFNCHGNYRIQGTLYPTAHEPNDCNGVNGGSTGAVVVITGSDGVARNLVPNGVGNFETATNIPTPFTARVTYQGRTRAMTASQTNGNCNSCHTQNGSGGAPGRIILP